MFLNAKNLRIIFCSPSLQIFEPKCSKSSNILKYFYYLKYLFLSEYILKWNLFPWSKINGQHQYPFNVTLFFRNHSNMLICCSINILLLLLSILKQLSTLFVWWIERFKDQHFTEIKSFCNIINYTIQKLRVSILCVCVCVGGGRL